MVERFAFTCAPENAGARLDHLLDLLLPDASRTRVQKWIENGNVRVNGAAVRKSHTMAAGETITVAVPEDEIVPNRYVEPEDIPLEFAYEDKYLAVVNKPKGMVTHPGHGVRSGTLANALAFHFKGLSDLGGADRPGIVHRLDRDTSGLLVVARDNATHSALAKDLAERKISRTYQALCWREPPEEGTFDWPLGRHEKDPTKRAIRADGKAAVTHYRVLDWYQFAAHLEVRLETGRTHQIRVHLSHAGYPVVGDHVYGGRDTMQGRVPPLHQTPSAGMLKRLNSQALHAAKLSFTHPRTRKVMTFESPLPDEFRNALEFLKPYKRNPEE